MSEPQRLGRYELLEQLGEGGMGAVWLARLSGTGGFEKLCIVKTVLPAIAKEKQFVSRFLHEGRVLTQLQHGNIAQIYDMSEEAGTLFLALEYVAGVDLSRLQSDLTEQGLAMPVQLAAFMMQQAAEGLAFAHRKAANDGTPLHVVHRDVSPQNIMVSYEGEVKVIDFGIAKSEARSHATATQMVMGKLGYMAPEQALAQGVDHRADQYALAVVLWELLANTAYVPRGTMTEMLMAMAQPRTHPLAPLRPDVPASLEQIVLKALAVNPADRFATTDDFARALLEQLVSLGGMPSRVQLGEFVKAHCSRDFQAQRALITRAATIRFAAPQAATQPLPADAGMDKTFSRAVTLGDSPATLATPTTAPPAPALISNPGPTAPTPAPPPKPVGSPFPDPLAEPPMSTAELKAAAMPKSKAPLFIALAVVLLLGVGAVGAGAYWFTHRAPAAPAVVDAPKGTPPTGTAPAANPPGTAPTPGTAVAATPSGAVPPSGTPTPPPGTEPAANPPGSVPPGGTPPPGAEPVAYPPGTVPPGTVAAASPPGTPPPPPTTVETGSPGPTGATAPVPPPTNPYLAGPGTVEPRQPTPPPPPPPAVHGPLTGLARYQRGAMPSVMISNSSGLTWTNCTVYLSGGRRGALKALSPGFSRELLLRDFVVDRSAPPLSGQVKVVCPQGTGLLKSNE